ncbi:CLUMA_CG011727, isoform A [Clunio marinus]|uniref:CLUMA_CG011727, isoform A n=1 Tax=Clunio marinus TaxID=568069 RepID=A0A1J1IDS4_9DIPT|nr:CLUMA_CG011727, isoform A [Clunio marinus]
MKVLAILVLFFLAVTSDGDVETKLDILENKKTEGFEVPTAAMTASMNAYTDLIMIQVGPWILRSGLIPMPLPDFEEFIEYRPIFVTYTGWLWLTNGAMTRLVSVARGGNTFMTYDRNLMRIQQSASIRQIGFRYDYSAEIMGIGPTGWLEGSTDQFTMNCDFVINLDTFMITLHDFRVQSIGLVTIVMRGNPLIDWLSNLIVNTVTLLFRGPIADVISLRFKEFLQETIDDMNNRRFAATHSITEIEKILQNAMSLNGLATPLN